MVRPRRYYEIVFQLAFGAVIGDIHAAIHGLSQNASELRDIRVVFRRVIPEEVVAHGACFSLALIEARRGAAGHGHLNGDNVNFDLFRVDITELMAQFIGSRDS